MQEPNILLKEFEFLAAFARAFTQHLCKEFLLEGWLIGGAQFWGKNEHVFYTYSHSFRV